MFQINLAWPHALHGPALHVDAIHKKTISWPTDSGYIKVMGLLFSMDQMVGKDFEIGLANLKSIAENQVQSFHTRQA
jgi:hypothetical protein